MLTALLVQRSASPAGTCTVAHDHSAFFSAGSSAFEHATCDDAAAATRSARSPELMMRDEGSLLMHGHTARLVPSIRPTSGMCADQVERQARTRSGYAQLGRVRRAHPTVAGNSTFLERRSISEAERPQRTVTGTLFYRRFSGKLQALRNLERHLREVEAAACRTRVHVHV